MNIVIKININNDRPPFIERVFKGSELVSERLANVLAYYDVTLSNTGQMSIFSVSLTEKQVLQFEECDFVFSANDYPLRKYLLELNIFEDKVDEIMERVINEINDLYFDKKENILLEIET
ncbi:hypothetical protein [Flavobacterium macacae]|uniref:Uncharacterized protein n=1 Tax=Flavobacterium macacae TaxID=2488993 RepID=A0A3P3W431_9FLAO|nr:hypothetical protein [Flavobacterium macacae]RRJ89720.1 hypothetical protein EG849_11955 [Flavobacterium macacae]